MKRLLALALAATAIPLAPAAAQTTASIAPLGPTSTLLSLNAEGRSTRTPDLAMFSSGVVTNGRTAADAMADNARQMERVVAALKRSGIADKDIQTSAITLQPRYSNPDRDAQLLARQTGQPYVQPVDQTPRIIGYEARNTVSVRVRNLAKMGGVIDTLIAAGANEVNGPSFTLEEQKEALDEARLAAIASGRERAELYARAAGLRVARIVSISESGGYYPVQEIFVTARGAMAPPAPPPPPTPVSPGELALGVNLAMQFELVR